MESVRLAGAVVVALAFIYGIASGHLRENRIKIGTQMLALIAAISIDYHQRPMLLTFLVLPYGFVLVYQRWQVLKIAMRNNVSTMRDAAEEAELRSARRDFFYVVCSLAVIVSLIPFFVGIRSFPQHPVIGTVYLFAGIIITILLVFALVETFKWSQQKRD